MKRPRVGIVDEVVEGYTLELDEKDLKGLGRIKPKVVKLHAQPVKHTEKATLLDMFRKQGTPLSLVVEEMK
jgi:hypothetical protein